jgi:bifunctional non-homologous end joining protein LigD
MALEKYKEKRKFNRTPEPTGGKAGDDQLVFVIQKHKASHLHYDFRLEMRAVLKSWAVPKGPSTDASVKRLAMLVEDHPFDYKDFEGIIPKGNYGAGTVIIWDQGTYEPVEKVKGKKEQEKILLKGFYSGALRIILHGKKLKGAYTLAKTSGAGENAWLLMKAKDKFAAKTDITKKEKSVVSGETIETLSANPSAKEWQSNRKTKRNQETKGNKTNKQPGRKAPIPAHVSPMLCTLTREPINDEEYIYEIKWDGYRIISYVNGSKVRMDSRSAIDYTKKYPPIAKALKALGHKMVLDGEVVVFNEAGLPDFDALQLYNGHNTPIHYCVFDILWLDGYDLRALPLVQRKEIVKELVEGNDIIRFSESFDDGPGLYEQMLEKNLEGIVAKKKDSEYIEGNRGNDWLKTPTRKRQEFVIGGWAESDKARSFRSLLFGAYNDKGQFEWIGRSGGGYKQKDMPGILAKLKKLEINQSPFINKVLDTKGAATHYVKPQLVANFEFATWTKSGRIRKPATFLGFRKDKKAKDVVREVPKPIAAIEEQIGQEDKPAKKKATSKSSNWRVLEKIRPKSTDEFNLGDCTLELTDVDRNIWKDIPKAKLIEYYHAVSKYILPHLTDRPLSLHVKPHGAKAPGLYIKDMEGRGPDCAEIFRDKRRHAKAGKNDIINYLVCNNEATLLYIINLGCIDLNPWMSRTTDPLHPDFINIDLDPSDNDFNKVIETALAAKEVLAEYKLKSYVKTSGKTGMHIFIPVQDLSFPQARNFSEIIGAQIHKLLPKITTTNVSVSSRGSKLFIDPSQNDYADTLASAYSVRPHSIPAVSTPLDWKEIKPALDPCAFTIETLLPRLRKKGDLFKDVLSPAIARRNSINLKKLL